MSNPITLDDIYALFGESERQRQEHQRAYEQEMADLRKQSDRDRPSHIQSNIRNP